MVNKPEAPKASPPKPNTKSDVPTDADIANPVDAGDVRLPPNVNQPAEAESWGDRTARQARENEKALAEGKPLPHPTD